MSGVVLVLLLVLIGGGGSQANENIPQLSDTKTTMPPLVSNHQHHHHYHSHRHRGPMPSPFTTKGRAIINQCTLSLQQHHRWRLPKWSDEFLIPPLPIADIKPEVLEAPHKIGGLFCRAGIWMEIVDKDVQRDAEAWLKHYHVRGTHNVESRYALLEFYSIAIGLLSIRSLETKNFLCMNRRGELYNTPLSNYTVECVFMEDVLENYYTTYASCAYGSTEKPWYIAFRHSGIPRSGRRAAAFDVGAQFVTKELNKDFWVAPKVVETLPNTHNGFTDDGYNWLEKMTNKWLPDKLFKEPPPSLGADKNHDSRLLSNNYNQIPNIPSHTDRSKDIKTRTDDPSAGTQAAKPSDYEARKKTLEELKGFMERKQRRMEREEQRRRHRRKNLEQLRRQPASNKLRSVARYSNPRLLQTNLQRSLSFF